MGATFLVCHGAWSAGWAWKKMHPLMAAAGHRLIAPTYTGLGERAHLANPAIDLETHIQDILNVIKFEGLSDIVLRIPPGDVFGQFARRAKSEVGWRYFELDASHAPNVTAPDALMGVLREIVG